MAHGHLLPVRGMALDGDSAAVDLAISHPIFIFELLRNWKTDWT